MGMAVDDDLMNFYEQLLVALFGDCLLNTELGGKDVIFITEEDQEAFGQLRSHTIESFNTTKPCSAHMMQAIETYAQNVRAYVDSHPTTRKGRRSARRFNDETEAMLIRQGTPRTLSIDGSAVTVTLGSDLGEDHEQDEGTFWEAGGRSADVVTNIYSRFLEWEAGPTASYNPIGFKSLCENHLWPMADVFAWYVKHKEDYSKAGEFLASYINAVRPWIIICYGSLPTFAAQRNFESFTQNQYDNKISNDNYHWRQNNSSWAQDVLAVPQVLSFNAGQGPTTDKEFLLIPCYHPGFTGHSGVLKEKLTRLLVLTHALAWAATHHAIVIDRENPTRARRDKINMLHSMLLTKISTTHPFGRALADAKAAYKDVTKAHNECSLQRAGNTALRKPRTGLLPGKTVKKPAKSPVRSGETVAEIGEGFKVTLEETGWIPGATGIDAKRHRLNWTESDGQERTLHHIMLPAGVAPTDPNTPRFLYYVPGGIDIRDNADTSLGARKPILGRSGRTETLPLASIALSMCERPEASTFFEHWEEVTRLSSMDVMQSGFVGSRSGSSATRAARGGRLPKSFFDKSPSKRGFPFNKSVNLVNTTGKPYLVYTELLRQKFTPVNHGDLLWLIDRFLMEHFPKGGALDPVPGSVHADSMFLLVTDFCAQPKYMHHPHLRTFLAMASMSEMGLDERNIPINAFRMAVSVIRGTFTESASRAVLKINNERLEFKRQIMTIKSKRMRIFHDVDEDDLDYSVELIADEAFSAEVGDSAEEGDNDDEMLFDLSSSGKGKGKGQMVEDDDAYDANDSSEILF